MIHSTPSQRTKKCDSAITRLRAINDSIKYTALDRKLSPGNVIDSFHGFDVIVDATDNFEAR